MSIQLKNEVSELRARLDQVEKILKREFPQVRTVAGKPDVQVVEPKKEEGSEA